MWLEQTVWVWLPVICASGAWVVWRIVELGRELRSLRDRVSHLENYPTMLKGTRRAAG
jgi:hypothetical protein